MGLGQLYTQPFSATVNIALEDARLQGFLRIPQGARGVVIFAHGSGSSRLSPRNRFVADHLYQRKIGTLLFDLLTAQEEERDMVTAEHRFDIPFLAGRLVGAIDWLTERFKVQKPGLPIGLFGASTGAAAALVAAVERPDIVKAVVSRGGRPDLAGPALPWVAAPALLIVGGDDTEVLELNRGAYRSIHAPKDLCIVKGATHLFEEPGTLEKAADAAGAWFEQYLKGHA